MILQVVSVSKSQALAGSWNSNNECERSQHCFEDGLSILGGDGAGVLVVWGLVGGGVVERCEEEETGATTDEVEAERVVLAGRAEDNCGWWRCGVSATVGATGGCVASREREGCLGIGMGQKLSRRGELPAPRRLH